MRCLQTAVCPNEIEPAINRWETGKAYPRAAQLLRIHEVLNLGKRKALALLAEAQ